MKTKLIKFSDKQWDELLRGCAASLTFNISDYIRAAIKEKNERVFEKVFANLEVEKDKSDAR